MFVLQSLSDFSHYLFISFLFVYFYISPHLKSILRCIPSTEMLKWKKKYILELVQYGICFLGIDRVLCVNFHLY